MAFILSATALAATLVTVVPSQHPISPLSIDYSNSRRKRTKVCGIVASLTNPGPPEQVTLTIFAGYDKIDKAIAVGFLVNATKISLAGNFDPIDIANSAVISDSFNSNDGIGYAISAPETFMAMTDGPEIGHRFFDPLMLETFF